jgi:hypothetical protein
MLGDNDLKKSAGIHIALGISAISLIELPQ